MEESPQKKRTKAGTKSFNDIYCTHESCITGQYGERIRYNPNSASALLV